MSAYDRLLGVDEFGGKVSDSVLPEVLASLLMEYSRGELIIGVNRPLDHGLGELTSQGATTVINPAEDVNTRFGLLATVGEGDKAIDSVVDDKGNTWTVDHVSNGTGTEWISFASAPITTTILTSDDITITWTEAASGTIRYSLLEAGGLDPTEQFVEAVVSPQVDENFRLSFAVAQQSAVLHLMAHSNGGGDFNPLTGFEDGNFEEITDDTYTARAATYVPAPYQVEGTWGTPGDGIFGAAVYRSDENAAVMDLIQSNLQAPLTSNERIIVRDFLQAVDAAPDEEVYIGEVEDVLRLASRLTPGYTNQDVLIARLL